MSRVILAVAVIIAAACSSKAPAPAQHDTAWAPEVREGYAVTPDSVRIYYRIVGDGPETVIVAAANYFLGSLDGLATPARRLVLYDMRGRGKTDSVPPSKMGIAEFDATDIEVLRTLVGAERVALIGWSGAVLPAFRYAVEHPERVSALVLFTPVGPRWVPWWDDMRKNAAAKADTAGAAALAAREKAGEFANNEVALCRESAALGLKTNWVVTTQIHLAPDVCDSPNEVPSRYGDFVPRLLAKLGTYDYRNDFGKVRARRLVIHGEFDNPPEAGSREWIAGQPDARFLLIKGVGHWPHYEKPAQTLAALTAFLDGGWPEGSEVVPGAK